MSTQSEIKTIEILNNEIYELKNSKYYLIGKIICFFLHFRIRRGVQYLKSFFLKRKIAKLSSPKHPFFYNEGCYLSEKKGVVYTCVTNNYDCIVSPILKPENVDFILFTDKKNGDFLEDWKEILLGEHIIEQNGNYANRFCKLNPFLFFEGYDFAVYVDGCIQVVSDVRPLFSVAQKSKTGLAMHLHMSRNCAYAEAKICRILKKGDAKKIEEQMNRYRVAGFPEHFGLLEATIIVVDLHNENAKMIMNDWWHEFVTSGSGRDQLSLPYVLWKSGFNISDIGILGSNRSRNPKFRTTSHF